MERAETIIDRFECTLGVNLLAMDSADLAELRTSPLDTAADRAPRSLIGRTA